MSTTYRKVGHFKGPFNTSPLTLPDNVKFIKIGIIVESKEDFEKKYKVPYQRHHVLLDDQDFEIGDNGILEIHNSEISTICFKQAENFRACVDYIY